ncbi:MAG: CDP-alcohol phosphatidyltransferase family protein [Myxococcales bacterium]|nr:CDP-alcohol phosphatidyltransferase family protein [Myxococcales bacterium]
MSAAAEHGAPFSALILAGNDERDKRARRWLLGLTLVERLALDAKHRGAERVALRGDVELLPVKRRDGVAPLDADDDISAIEAERALEPERDLLVVAADVIYHPQLIGKLRAAAARDGCSQIYRGGEGAEPILYLRGADAERIPKAGSLADLADALAAGGVAHRFDAPDGFFAIAPRDAAGTRAARRAFMKTNWRPHDGIIARVLNKHMSVPISTLLVHTPITPNLMTGLSFIMAMVGVYFASLGTYWTFLIGATLVQIQSVLDGCDGEIARAKYKFSNAGAWFDTIVDDVIGISWVVALGVGCWRATGEITYAIVGSVAAAMYFTSTGLVFIALLRYGAASHSEFVYWFEEGTDPHEDYPDLKKLSTWGKYFVRRDFFVFFFWLLSLGGLIRVSLAFAVAGAVGWFTVAMIQFAKRGMRVVPPEEIAERVAARES